MRRVLVCLAVAGLVAGCSKTPKPAADSAAPASSAAPAPAAVAASAAAPAPALSGPELAGVYSANGKPAALTQVRAYKDEPFDDQPVTALVFTTQDQSGDEKPAFDAPFGKLGDAIVVKVQPDGSVIGVEVVHSGFKGPGQTSAISISGVLSIKDYSSAGGQISGHLTSGGPTDVFDQKMVVDLTFHTKAP